MESIVSQNAVKHMSDAFSTWNHPK